METERAFEIATRMDPWIRAHARMAGRYDAAELEQRRAIKDGRIADSYRWGRVARRRLRAMMRISAAMDALVRSRHTVPAKS